MENLPRIYLVMAKLQARHEVPGIIRKIAPSQRDD
jgi:hypothetical protein